MMSVYAVLTLGMVVSLTDAFTSEHSVSAVTSRQQRQQQPAPQAHGLSRPQPRMNRIFATMGIHSNIDNQEAIEEEEQANTNTISPGQAIQRLGSESGPTVWSEFARIGAENDIVANLGQGFPSWLPPIFATESLVEAVMDIAKSPHQYTRPAGHPDLVHQLAARYSIHLNRQIDELTQVAVTVGASQALYLSLQSIISEGDEVVLFEPFFDLYENQIRLAGGTPVFAPLRYEYSSSVDDSPSSSSSSRGGEWTVDRDALMNAVSSKTKAVILNSPHNPTGKVFTRKEMEVVAEALELAGPDCVVLSDEVYKYIVHSPPKEDSGDATQSTKESGLCVGHTHFASLPGMWDRTITISSAGKTFSATGWQVGWCVGPQHLIGPIHKLLPYVQFCASTVMQEALARSLARADNPYEGHKSYYEYLKAKYTKKRDMLASALSDAGFIVPDYDETPGGGFFIFARAGPEIRQLVPKRYLDVENKAARGQITRMDWALCEWLAEEIGILCIPSSPFFSLEQVERGVSDPFIRVAFCKSDEMIQAAATALKRIKESTAPTAEQQLQV
mmetsp:Transcript_20964/g.49798  ORF Transcript_20964/g.49798 Transcript_20964/m.49798 type:complete len:560 (-) Transcript_20964:276-1955(-)